MDENSNKKLDTNTNIYLPMLNQILAYYYDESLPSISEESKLLSHYKENKESVLNSKNYSKLRVNQIKQLSEISNLYIYYNIEDKDENDLIKLFKDILKVVFNDSITLDNHINLINTKKLDSEICKNSNNNELTILASECPKFLINKSKNLNDKNNKVIYSLICNSQFNNLEKEKNNLLNEFFENSNNKNEFTSLLDLTFVNIYQQYSIIKELSNTFSSNKNMNKKDMLNEVIKNKIITLNFQKSNDAKKDYRKFLFCVSNKEVYHKFHIATNDISIDEPFDVISSKIDKICDTKEYNLLLENIVKYSKNNNSKVLLLNPINELNFFFDKEMMIKKISDVFNNCIFKENPEYSNFVDYPKITTFMLRDIIQDKVDDKNLNIEEAINKELSKQKIKLDELYYPQVIKKGHSKIGSHHDVFMALNKQGVIEFINTLINEYRAISITGKQDILDIILLQDYVKADAVIKGYYIARKSFLYKRPVITNDFIEDKQNKPLIKLDRKSIELRTFNEKYKLEIPEIQKIFYSFEKYSNINLFGLDFMYDSNRKKYFMIDWNFYPGYKELLQNIPELINEHILIQYKEKIASN